MPSYMNGQAVWVEPEQWRAHVLCFSSEGDADLYLASVDGQNRATWRRADQLRPREVEGIDPYAPDGLEIS